MKLELNNGHIHTFKIQETLNAAAVQNTWYDCATLNNVIIYGISVVIEDTDETLEARATIDGLSPTLYGALAATHSTAYDMNIYPNQLAAANFYVRFNLALTHPIYAKSFSFGVRKTTNAGAGSLDVTIMYGELEAI